MSYYVSHMTPIKRARVHRGSCVHCRDGLGQVGQHRNDSGNTGWSAQFATYSEADAYMRKDFAAFTDVGTCGHCKPGGEQCLKAPMVRSAPPT